MVRFEDDLPVAEPEEIEKLEDHCRDVSKVEEHGVDGTHQRTVSGLRVPGTQGHLSPNTQHLANITQQLTISTQHSGTCDRLPLLALWQTSGRCAGQPEFPQKVNARGLQPGQIISLTSTDSFRIDTTDSFRIDTTDSFRIDTTDSSPALITTESHSI